MSYVMTPPQSGYIDYNIGDELMSQDGNLIGICTGFTHNDTCVEIDGTCWGGKYYFNKCSIIDIDYEIIN